LRSLFAMIAGHLGSTLPTSDWAGMARQIVQFEDSYGIGAPATKDLHELRHACPDLFAALVPLPVATEQAVTGLDHFIVDRARPWFESLNRQGLLQYEFISGVFRMSTDGFIHKFDLRVTKDARLQPFIEAMSAR
jgi:hypothetical protein